jgi:hypothetical protein
MDLKVFTIVVTCIIISLGLASLYGANQIMYAESYSKAILRGHDLVGKQRVLQIEYALQYGKDIRKFYNMKNNMNQIVESLPGVNDIEIYGIDGELLYDAFEERKNNNINEIFMKKNKRMDDRDEGLYHTLVIPIKEKNKKIIANMIINIEKKVIEDDIRVHLNELGIQFYLFTFASISLVILLLSRINFDFTIRRNRKHFVYMLILMTIGMMVLFNSYILIDTSKALMYSFEEIGDWICSIIQNDINEIINKGVRIDEIHDLNGWLEQISSQLPEIDNLFVDSDNKVQAVMSNDFINKQVNEMILNGVIIGIGCIFVQIIFARCIFKLEEKIYKTTEVKEGKSYEK